MEIRSKFNGTCTLCGNTFPAGTVINWNKQNGAWHLAGDCRPRPVKPVAVAPAVRVEGAAVVAFLRAARERGLKAPKVRFLAPGGGELRLSLAAGQTRYPGAVQVKVNGLWVGRIGVDGVLTDNLAAMPGMTDALAAIAADPFEAARRYGALMGRCTFCGKTLTDAGSVEAGYGPVCAEKYSRPHTAKGTPAVAVPVERPAPVAADVPRCETEGFDIGAALDILRGRAA